MFVNSLFISSYCYAQDQPTSSLEDILEDIAINSETNMDVDKPNFEESLEALSSLKQSPLNLNIATREQLERFPFLSDLQIEHLLAYVYLHGEMKTLYELQLVEDMDRRTIGYLLPFVCVEPVNSQSSFQWKSLWKETSKYGKHEALTRMDIPFYRRKGYEHSYLGPSVYNSLKYTFRAGEHLYASFVAEKDAGEPFGALHNRKGYDYYSFCLLLKNCGKLKALAVGNYRLSFGQGLVVSTDYLMGNRLYATSFNVRSSGIRHHASTDEYNYFRGVAATLALGRRWETSAFYSYRPMDGTVKEGVVTSIYKSGLHRSSKEAAKQGAFALWMAGGNVTYQQSRIKLGITALYYAFNRPYKPLLTGYSTYLMNGQRFYNVGIDYGYRQGRFSLQGEAARGRQGWASVNRLYYSPVQGTSLMLLHRYYSYNYWAMFARSFGQGSAVQNEQGYYIGVDTSPFSHWNFTASADFFSFPWKKYRISKRGSRGVDGQLQATFTPRDKLSMYLRYRYKRKERDWGEGDARQTLPTHHHQLRYRLSYVPSALFGTRTTMDYNRFHYQDRSISKGYLFSELISLRLPTLPLSADLQGSYFHTTDYDSRVYLSEPGLLYTFSAPSFRGRGFRFSARLRYEPNRHWMLLAKFEQTAYTDRAEIGSGDDLIPGNKKADLQLQLRIRW
jgi:hypothetical protein